MIARAAALIAARITGALIAALAIGIDGWRSLAIAVITGTLPTLERLLRTFASTGRLTSSDLGDVP